ncbi:MAG: hypothetical protein ABSG51_05680 [Terracidiphilus sp.]|jgi:hypothetical protein
MGAPRRVAERLLRTVIRLAPDDSREWASAMLRELDFVEGDWEALFWALGSATAILRHAASLWREWLKGRTKEEVAMNSTGRKALGVGLGAFSALMLVGCAFAMLRIVAHLFPGLGLDHLEWTHWLTVIVVPEIVFIAAAVMLWRKRGPVAAGILTTALVIGLHLAAHLTAH